MARKLGFRPKLKQTIASGQAAQDFYEMSLPPSDPRYKEAQIRANQRARELVERVKAKPRAAPRQLEAPIVSAIADLLAVHPKVLFAVRQNSGAASYEAKSGTYAPVHFYRILTSQPVTITDFWGILRDGRPFAVEAKAPGFKHPRTEREFKQALFLGMINNVGGIGLFASDAAQVAEALK